MVGGICATNYRREDMGRLLIPPLGTQIFQYASCIIYLRHFWYYSDTTIYITGWGQVEIQGYIHLGMQMPTICTTYLDFAQDTSRILGW